MSIWAGVLPRADFLGTSLPDAPLFYANAQTLRDRLTELVPRAEPPVHTVVLDLDANDSLDITM